MATPVLKPDPAACHMIQEEFCPELTVLGPVSSRIKLAGLRKTALVIDGLLSPTETSGLIQEAYQPCHGGFQRVFGGVEDGSGLQYSGIGGSCVRTQLQPAVTDILWSRLGRLLPLRYVMRVIVKVTCVSVETVAADPSVPAYFLEEYGSFVSI
jgi:hypothetical protein